MHVRAQDETSRTTPEEALAVCKFECPHLNCGFKFLTKHGLKIHMGRCEWKDEYQVEAIVGHRGPLVTRKYKIRWKDYSSDFDTWEPRSNIHPELIKEYEVDNNIYDYEWSHRCEICDLACSSARGVAIHKTRAHKKVKTQNFFGTLADKAVTTCKIIEQQEMRPKIKCGDRDLENVFRSK